MSGMKIFLSLLGLAIVLIVIVFAIMARRRQRALGPVPPRGSQPAIGSSMVSPRMLEFHVRGDEAQVYFEVPVGPGKVEPVLADLLASAAIEVVREKRHSLPIGDVRKLVAFAKGGSGWVRVKEVMLAMPGELPPPAPAAQLLPHGGRDLISAHFEEEAGMAAPGLVEGRRPDRVGPAGSEIRLTSRLEAGLRAGGIDPAKASAGELVLGVLRLAGFQLVSAAHPETHLATKGGVRTYLRIDDFAAGDYPEISEQDVTQFMIGFASSGADRGIFVSDRYRPLLAHEKERREPRIRFVTREGLQRFIDGAAMG